MYNCGMGPWHLNKFLSGMDLPTISSTAIVRQEHVIGKTIQTAAKRSCETAMKEEIRYDYIPTSEIENVNLRTITLLGV